MTKRPKQTDEEKAAARVLKAAEKRFTKARDVLVKKLDAAAQLDDTKAIEGDLSGYYSANSLSNVADRDHAYDRAIAEAVASTDAHYTSLVEAVDAFHPAAAAVSAASTAYYEAMAELGRARRAASGLDRVDKAINAALKGLPPGEYKLSFVDGEWRASKVVS